MEPLKLIVHAPQFLITWFIFFGCGILIYSINAIKQKNVFALKEIYNYCVPFSIVNDISFHADVKIYLIGKITDAIIFMPTVLLNFWICTKLSQMLAYTMPGFRPMSFGYFAAFVSTITIFVFGEFSNYICHYAEHKVPPLWEIHKLHHSAQFLNPLTTKRAHPVSELFGATTRAAVTAVPGALFIFLYGVTVVEAAALSLVASRLFVIATLDPLKHSHHTVSLGVFDKLLISPHMHQIHHSKTRVHWDKNFGVHLSVFDWMFGTAYQPKRGETAVYGISGHSEETLRNYNSLYGAYVQPLVKAHKKIKKMLADFRPESQPYKSRSQI